MLDNINNTPITYFFRNHRSGFSIYKAISPIVKDCDKIYIVPKYRGDILSVLTNMLFARRHFNRNGINHVTGDVHYLVLAMLGCKTVLTIHDMVAVKTASNPIKKALLKWLWFKLPLRFADRITCISESTKKQLLENFKIKSQKKSQKFWRIIFLTYLCTRNPIETTTPQGCKVHKHPGGG